MEIKIQYLHLHKASEVFILFLGLTLEPTPPTHFWSVLGSTPPFKSDVLFYAHQEQEV